ncbi:MAG: hypothetical protein K5853_07900 [Lachnospiraceae bacterium]|nr:hypothetical protein [Lachnospiraceae bacterium]
MLSQWERKWGKYAIKNLIIYLIGGYVIGYMLEAMYAISGGTFNLISYMTLEPHYIIHNFQIWRIFTWVLIPPPIGTGMFSIFFAAIMIFFYYQLGRILEQTIGTFWFNVYIFGGMLFTIIGAFLYYIVNFFALGNLVSIGGSISTHYINLSIFLAFALCYPDMQVMLYFLIPIKMKWMAILYGVFIFIELISVGWGGRVAIISSLLNFVIFFFATQRMKGITVKNMKRKADYRRATEGFRYESRPNSGPRPTARSEEKMYRHKCAICGRTDITNPELTFRFCSKCNGNYEYCNDHLFTHTHVQ